MGYISPGVKRGTHLGFVCRHCPRLLADICRADGVDMKLSEEADKLDSEGGDRQPALCTVKIAICTLKAAKEIFSLFEVFRGGSGEREGSSLGRQ